jgi:hypothetical protein
MSETVDKRPGKKQSETTDQDRRAVVPAASNPAASTASDDERAAKIHQLLELRRAANAARASEGGARATPFRAMGDGRGAASGVGGRGRGWLLRQALANRAGSGTGGGAGGMPMGAMGDRTGAAGGAGGRGARGGLGGGGWLLRQALAKRAANNQGGDAGAAPQRPLGQAGQNPGQLGMGMRMMLMRRMRQARQQGGGEAPQSIDDAAQRLALEQRVRELAAEVEKLRSSQTTEPAGSAAAVKEGSGGERTEKK